MKDRMEAIRRRLGPLGMSLAAAALTAAAFAAISVADSDEDGKKGRGDVERAAVPAPPPGAHDSMLFRERLSEEDRQKLEEFRQCMEDNGAPPPPDPGEFRRGDGPPEPPSEAKMEKIEQASEACREKLPEEMQDGPRFHGFGGPGCGPPPGAPDQEEGENREQREGSSALGDTQSSGAAA